MKTLKFNKELKIFYILQLGDFISQFGSKMTSFALIMWAYELSGSVLSTSALTVCTLLPSTLMGFFAGSFIDRWKKKKILLSANVIATFFSFVTLLLIITNKLNIVYLYTINLILGIVNAFQDPASAVMISLIVPKKYYTKISGLRSLASTCTTTFAPILATSLYALIGLKAIVSIDLFSFLFSFLFAFTSLLFFVHVPNDKVCLSNEAESFFSNCKKGVHYIAERKDIFHLVMYMAFVNLIAAIYNCNFAPMILSRNGNDKFQLGIVSSMVGVAGIIGSLLVTILKEPRKRIPVIINSMMFSFLICNSLLAIGRTYYVWSTAVLLGECLVPFLMANVEYIMRTRVPIELQGRVFAARNTLQYFSIPLGYILGGIIADKLLKPFMAAPSSLQQVLSYIVGKNAGSGNALIYLVIAIIGFLGCCYFKFDKYIKSLDE